MDVYVVTTAHGTILQAERTSGRLCHGETVRPGCAAVLALVPAHPLRFCVLFSEGAIRLDGHGARPGTIGLRTERLGGELALHPAGGRYACAEPGGTLVADRPAVGPWERFRLHRVEAPEELRGAAAALADTFGRAATVEGVLALLRAGGVAPGLDAAVAGLRAGELAWLGRRIGRDEAAAAGLARLMPEDDWARLALPALAAFNAGGAHPGASFVRAIDQTLDHLASDGDRGVYASAAQMLNAFARRDVSPSRGLCVVATARNEGLYLLEWIAFHRLAGVEAFFLYTNDNDDGSDQLLEALAGAGLVNWIRNATAPGVSPQFKAYGHAFQLLPEILAYRWAAVIDIDEFVVVDAARYGSIPDFLAAREAQDVDAVALNWLVFTSAGQTAWSGRPVIDRFQRRQAGANAHVKTICRPNVFIHAQCHYPVWDDYTKFTFRTATGAVHPQSWVEHASAFSAVPEAEHAWINHYLSKSAQEFLLRRTSSRGDFGLALRPSSAHFTSQHVAYFRDTHGSADDVDDARARACVPGLDQEIAALMALPGVAAASAEIERRFAVRMADLAVVLRDDTRFQEPGSTESWFLGLLG